MKTRQVNETYHLLDKEPEKESNCCIYWDSFLALFNSRPKPKPEVELEFEALETSFKISNS